MLCHKYIWRIRSNVTNVKKSSKKFETIKVSRYLWIFFLMKPTQNFVFFSLITRSFCLKKTIHLINLINETLNKIKWYSNLNSVQYPSNKLFFFNFSIYHHQFNRSLFQIWFPRMSKIKCLLVRKKKLWNTKKKEIVTHNRSWAISHLSLPKKK